MSTGSGPRGKGRGVRRTAAGADAASIGPSAVSSDSGVHSGSGAPSIAKSSSVQSMEVGLSGPCLMAPAGAKGTVCRPGGKVKVKTNVLLMDLPDQTVLWPYRVTISCGNGNFQRYLTRGSRDDYHRTIKRHKCYDVLMTLVAEQTDVFPQEKGQLIYDRATSLHSLTKLKGIGPRPTKYEVTVFDKDMNAKVVYTVEIEESLSGGVSLNDIQSLYNQDLNLRDMDPKKRIELLTSQTLYYKWNDIAKSGGEDSNRFLMMGDKGYYMASDKQLTNKCGPIFTRRGFKKSVKVVEGVDGAKPRIGLTIEVKLTAFFQEIKVTEILRQYYSNINLNDGLNSARQLPAFKNVAKMLKDLIITTEHTGRTRNFECRGLKLDASAANHTFNHGGQKITVADYFKERYKIDLHFPNLPCLYDEHGSLYPMELCTIAPHQRVPIVKQTQQQMKETIRDAAQTPSIRLATMQELVGQAQIRSNEWLQAAAISSLESWMVVDGRLLPMPMIAMKGKPDIRPDSRGEWKMLERGRAYQWLVPGRVNKVALLNFSGMPEGSIVKFWEKYAEFCNLTGLSSMPRNPSELTFENVSGRSESDCAQRIKEIFEVCARDPQNAPDFVFSVMPDDGSDMIHATLKLHEILTGIQTQNVKKTTVERVMADNSNAIIMNIIAKSNVKLGGVDSAITFNPSDVMSSKWAKWFEKDVMILGMDVNHPPPQSQRARRLNLPVLEPSVVGLSASTGNTIFEYTGDYWYVSARDENQAKYLDEHVRDLVSRIMRPGNGSRKFPDKFIFYRDGVSDSQMIHAMQVEADLLRKGLRMAADKLRLKDYAPKIAFILVIKRHNERLFKNNIKADKNDKSRAADQNVAAGLVVDSGIVHPTDNEFYLVAHTAITGTAQPIKCRILINELELTNDEMQNVTHTLCYGHQIISKAVSLPVPVYSAHDLAKRGKEIYRAWNYARGGDDSEETTDSGSRVPEPDWYDISNKLSVEAQHRLKFKKFWA